MKLDVLNQVLSLAKIPNYRAWAKETKESEWQPTGCMGWDKRSIEVQADKLKEVNDWNKVAVVEVGFDPEGKEVTVASTSALDMVIASAQTPIEALRDTKNEGGDDEGDDKDDELDFQVKWLKNPISFNQFKQIADFYGKSFRKAKVRWFDKFSGEGMVRLSEGPLKDMSVFVHGSAFGGDVNFGQNTKFEATNDLPVQVKLLVDDTYIQVKEMKQDGSVARGSTSSNVKTGTILWWSEEDGIGIVKDDSGNKWYIDTSVIKKGTPKRKLKVEFTPNPTPSYKFGTKNVIVLEEGEGSKVAAGYGAGVFVKVMNLEIPFTKTEGKVEFKQGVLADVIFEQADGSQHDAPAALSMDIYPITDPEWIQDFEHRMSESEKGTVHAEEEETLKDEDDHNRSLVLSAGWVRSVKKAGDSFECQICLDFNYYLYVKAKATFTEDGQYAWEDMDNLDDEDSVESKAQPVKAAGMGPFRGVLVKKHGEVGVRFTYPKKDALFGKWFMVSDKEADLAQKNMGAEVLFDINENDEATALKIEKAVDVEPLNSFDGLEVKQYKGNQFGIFDTKSKNWSTFGPKEVLRKRLGQMKAESAVTANVADKHQLKILKDTVKNPAKALLGGPSVEEAKKLLKEKFKYTDAQIKELEKVEAASSSDLAGAGFDLTSMPVAKWEELFDKFGLSKKPIMDTKHYAWTWKGPRNLTLYTGAEPFTGNMFNALQGSRGKGYAIYIGIRGPQDLVDAVYKFIETHGDSKDKNPKESTYIGAKLVTSKYIGLIKLQVMPNKDGKLVLDLEGFKENLGDEEATLEDKLKEVDYLMDAFFGNSSYEWVAPEDVGALTDAPIFGDVERDDMGEVLKVHELYWYPDYQLKDWREELINKGEVLFKDALFMEHNKVKASKAEAMHNKHPKLKAELEKLGFGEEDQEIITQVVLGRSNQQIAEYMETEEGLVKKQLAEIYKKAEVASRAQLIVKFLSLVED